MAGNAAARVARVVVGVEPADGRHQHLDHRPGLLGQPVVISSWRSRLTRAARAGSGLRERRRTGAGSACSERLKGVRFVEPGVAGPRGGGGGPTGGGADQCPFGAVGDQTEGDPARPQGVPEAVGETRRPVCRCRFRWGRAVARTPGSTTTPSSSGAEAGSSGSVSRAKSGRTSVPYSGTGVVRWWAIGLRRGIGLPAQKARQDMANECVARARAGVEHAAGLTQCADIVDIQGGQPAGPDVFDHRGGQESAVCCEEFQPFGGIDRPGGQDRRLILPGHRLRFAGTRCTTGCGEPQHLYRGVARAIAAIAASRSPGSESRRCCHADLVRGELIAFVGLEVGEGAAAPGAARQRVAQRLVEPGQQCGGAGLLVRLSFGEGRCQRRFPFLRARGDRRLEVTGHLRPGPDRSSSLAAGGSRGERKPGRGLRRAGRGAR